MQDLTTRSGPRAAARLAACIVHLAVFASAATAAPFAYVPNKDGDDVSVIDLATDTVVDTIEVGDWPTTVAVDPAAPRAYVANENDGTLSVIDTSANTVITTVDVGCTAVGVVLNPLGTMAYVGCGRFSLPSVVAIDTTTFSMTSVTVLDDAPIFYAQGLAIDAAGQRLYFQFTADFGIGFLYFIDVATLTVENSVAMTTGFFDLTVPLGLVVGSSGCRVYVPHPGANQMRILDPATEVVTPITLPSPSRAAVVNRAETIIYASMLNGSVAVIDRPSATLLTSIPVGSGYGLSLSADESLLYVANPAGDTVTLIDTATNTVSGPPITVGDNPVSVGNFIAPVCDDPEICDVPPACAEAPTPTPTATPTPTVGACENPELCVDGDPCTQDSCDPETGCVNDIAPRPSCRTALKSTLLLKDSDDDGKDKLIWKWIKGQSTSQAEFADPTTTTDYALCVYAGTSTALVTSSSVPAGPGLWEASGSSGYKYKDPAGTESGIQKIVLRASEADKAKVIMKGKGTSLFDPTLDLPEPVTAQLVKQESPLCWEAEYSGSAILENDSEQFKAKVK